MGWSRNGYNYSPLTGAVAFEAYNDMHGTTGWDILASSFEREQSWDQNERRGVLYLAERNNKYPERVFASVNLIVQDKRDGAILIKRMTEDTGPYDCNPGREVLAALTPTTSEHALDWRARSSR